MSAMAAHISPRRNVDPESSADEPAATLFVYAMTRPIAVSRTAYTVICRSYARHAVVTERDAQSVTRAGSARRTPIRPALRKVLASDFRSDSGRVASVALIEVAAMEKVRKAVVVLDPEMKL